MPQTTIDTIRDLLTFIPEDRLDRFREQLAAEAAAVSEGKFNFLGSARDASFCETKTPHPPHWTGKGYGTVRAGFVEYYCVGRPGGDLKIILTKWRAGSPEACSMHAGYWRRASPDEA